MIDGLNGVEACFYLAGKVGIDPKGKTLRQLCLMELGYCRQRRIETAELAQLVWLPKLDMDAYLWHGEMKTGKKGGKLPPEVEANVQKEIERIRREHPELPKVSY